MKRNPKPLMAIVDTREQTPLDLTRYVPNMQTVRQALPHGDYSLAWPALSDRVCIERKSLDDFLNCVGKERGRFETELLAMRSYEYKMLVIEARIEDIMSGNYNRMVHPNSAMSFLVKCLKLGITIIPAGNHAGAGYIVAKFLEFVAKQEIGMLLATASVFPTLDLSMQATAEIDTELLGYPPLELTEKAIKGPVAQTRCICP